GARVLGVLVERALPGHDLPGLGLRELEGLGETPRSLVAVDAVDEPPAGGEEGDGRERGDVVALRERRFLAGALGVDLQRHERLGHLRNRGIDVGRLVEALAPAAPLRPEVHHDRLVEVTCLLEAVVQLGFPADWGPGRGGRPSRTGTCATLTTSPRSPP